MRERGGKVAGGEASRYNNNDGMIMASPTIVACENQRKPGRGKRAPNEGRVTQEETLHSSAAFTLLVYGSQQWKARRCEPSQPS